MPVNMDPAKKRTRRPVVVAVPEKVTTRSVKMASFGQETEEDRVKDLADAETKNLWDATEVIDMDTA